MLLYFLPYICKVLHKYAVTTLFFSQQTLYVRHKCSIGPSKKFMRLKMEILSRSKYCKIFGGEGHEMHVFLCLCVFNG